MSDNIFAMRERGETVRVYQVDTTNRCDATCSYCPQPTHKRKRGALSMETFECVLDVASNRSFHLHHFSEPMLHPLIADFVEVATRRGFRVGFSTNGRLLTQEKLDNLAARGLAWLRLHTNPFGVRLLNFKVPSGLLMTEHRVGDDGPADAPIKPLVSYSGYVEGVQEADGWKRCSYLGYGDGVPWKVVLWDGSFAMCCVDVEGSNDPALCERCRGFVFTSPTDWGNYDGGEATPPSSPSDGRSAAPAALPAPGDRQPL